MFKLTTIVLFQKGPEINISFEKHTFDKSENVQLLVLVDSVPAPVEKH